MDSQAPTPQPGQPRVYSKRQTFLRRTLSSAVLWSVVLCAVFAENKIAADGAFLLIMLVLAAAGLIEFYGMVAKRGLSCFRGWGVFGGMLLIGSTFFYLSGVLGVKSAPSKANDWETCILILFVLGLCLKQFVSKTNTAGILAISTTLFGLMYVPWLLNFIQKINFFPGIDGRIYVFYFIVVTKFSDIGAYLVGSMIGKHKMIPRISPGKTWEGFGGAILLSTLASIAFSLFAKEKLSHMTLMHAMILGLILSFGAVIGDLIESLFKREVGMKDSGSMFPGIGGILDLLDSLLFNAPLMYLYLRHVLTG